MEGRETSEEDTVVELERETVRELKKMFRMYTYNTIFTFFGAVAGWVAFIVVLLVWLM